MCVRVVFACVCVCAYACALRITCVCCVKMCAEEVKLEVHDVSLRFNQWRRSRAELVHTVCVVPGVVASTIYSLSR